MLAAVPVPPVMTPLRMSVTCQASAADTRRSGVDALAMISLPLRWSTSSKKVGLWYSPRLARVAYALAMSIGRTSSVPRAIDGTRLVILGMPSRSAMSATLSGQSFSIRRAQTPLTDRRAAPRTETGPAPPPSYLATDQREPQTSWSPKPPDSQTESGEMPASSAAASTKGLNDDPGWRPTPWRAG